MTQHHVHAARQHNTSLGENENTREMKDRYLKIIMSGQNPAPDQQIWLFMAVTITS